jgi:hypothetical protein
VNFEPKDDITGGIKMNKLQEEYLSDTIGILVSYDNENTVEGLQKLIDETRERLIKIKTNTVTEKDFGR